jgi:hypothetical protein
MEGVANKKEEENLHIVHYKKSAKRATLMVSKNN